MPEVIFIIGLVALIGGAEVLVRGATALAHHLGVSSLIIGLTIVAFGTSAPEIGVAAAGALTGATDAGLGNVIGSNIFNLLLVVGLVSLLSPLAVQRRLVRIDVPIMVGIFALFLLLSLDGIISAFEGVVFAAVLVGHLSLTLKLAKDEKGLTGQGSPPNRLVRLSPLGVIGRVILLVVGLVILGFGSQWVVDGATIIARDLGISELIVGLTIIAVGTSLPEIATSLVALRRREKDLAVGNAIGSSIFNIVGVVPVLALLSPDGVYVAVSARVFDIPLMLVAGVVCLPIFFSGYRITRWEGFLLVIWYIGYITFLVFDPIDYAALHTINWIVLAFILPLAFIILVAVWWRSRRRTKGISQA